MGPVLTIAWGVLVGFIFILILMLIIGLIVWALGGNPSSWWGGRTSPIPGVAV